jgi:hypothetical protein
MACLSCKERAELLWRARIAYQNGDISEATQLLKQMFRTAISDVDKLDKHVSMIIHGMLSRKPEQRP